MSERTGEQVVADDVNSGITDDLLWPDSKDELSFIGGTLENPADKWGKGLCFGGESG